MTFNHQKYPIFLGGRYINDEQQIGTLESCWLKVPQNDADIVIEMANKGQCYRLNYATFCFYWKHIK
jgi:hypothetical protein